MVSFPPGHLHFITSNCRMKEGRVGVSVLRNPGGVPRMANDETSGSEHLASTQGASSSLQIMPTTWFWGGGTELIAGPQECRLPSVPITALDSFWLQST